ncbi:MAG: alpha-L-rhamnosidase C-terminal domain-containing protein, partial [Cyclobacteriaceae bacterium]
ALALLAGLADQEDKENMAKIMLSDTTLAPASIYFKYYLHLSLREAGMGDHYLEWLDIWRKNIELGLTTWGEDSQVEDTRSDCHAWGSSPNIEFFRIILGIESAAPNFSSVHIEPHLGNINSIAGSIPHPSGEISVDYQRNKDVLNAVIELPGEITGIFIWEGKEYPLKGGRNQFSL